MKHTSLAARFSFHPHRCADGVTIALRAAKAKGNRWRKILHYIFQQTQLRTIAVFQEHFLTAILIEIGQGKCSAVLKKVHSYCARNIRKCSIPVVGIENIPLEPAPGAVSPNEFIDGAPSLLVVVRRLRLVRRISHHLPPKKTVQILLRDPGNHAIRNIEIRKAVMIEVECVA